MHNLLFAIALFSIGQLFSWFTSYGQFISSWAKENMILLTCLLATPGTLFFVYGIKYAYAYFGNGWGPRFLAFALSFMIYPFMFSYFMKEDFLTTKNILCTILAFAIIIIQMRMK